MKAAVLFSFVAIFMAACKASSPKDQSHATKPAIVQAAKAATTMKDSTPMQRPVAPDTTTKYTEEDGGMTQIESKLFTETSSMHRQATVEMYYNGGVTTLILREQSGGVNRKIIHSAD